MESVRLKARAKINLGLDVVGRRDNGYHDVRMIMQTVGIYDRLIISKIPEKEVKIRTNLGFLPVNENNLIYKAYKLMQELYDLDAGIDVDLKKFIPVSAGMAGGSTDAASTLYAINKLFGLRLGLNKLMEIGVQLGADVPYCLLRGTALAEGIGEELTSLKAMPDCYIIIAKPPISVSTKLVYEKLDSDEVEIKHPDIDGIINGLNAGDLYEVASKMGNVLEQVTIPMYPVIDKIKQDILECGALNAMMSGSGPTVFGLFEDEERALACQKLLREKQDARQVYVTDVFNLVK